MDRVINFNTVSDYSKFNKNETLHPLVSIVDLSKAEPRLGYKMYFNLYCVVLKKTNCGDLTYGNSIYDYQEGTLVFFAPGQIAGNSNEAFYQPTGTALVFHPDLIHNTSLGKKINEYGFFSYNTNEGLHISDKEKKIVQECFQMITSELNQSIDKHSRKVVSSNIELLLNYCDRFYDRQFITREHINKGILEKFEELMLTYFSSDEPLTIGLPSVAYCADKLNLSPNYFGDLIKKETGKTAKEYIQNKIIEEAKNRIFGTDKTINEIAYELGFKYPQHFTRVFKSRTGLTPNEYRVTLN
ncbi:helix-turn-helix domain-containing protein [Sphingobacterium sp. MYb388]|uniref:helix-turn-helix domain-containing protein n=1 Tax=Sphingobacterium sp. MYb388 TaxID=2745437 RepID=UPI0030A9F05E